MTSATANASCNYCAANRRPLAWGSHDAYAYVDKIHADGPRLDIGIYEAGRHIKTHISIDCCPKCGAKLRKDAR